MYLELGEVFVEEILKEKRLGSKGFAWIRVSLQLGHSFGGNISFLGYQSYGFIILGFVGSISWYVLEFGG